MRLLTILKMLNFHSFRAAYSTHSLTGTMARLVERPLCNREVASTIPSRVIPKTLKMVLAALSLGVQHYESRARNLVSSVSV